MIFLKKYVYFKNANDSILNSNIESMEDLMSGKTRAELQSRYDSIKGTLKVYSDLATPNMAAEANEVFRDFSDFCVEHGVSIN